MSDYNCNSCDKDFDNQESLNQHNLAKHTIAQKPVRSFNFKKYGFIAVVLVLIIGAGAYFSIAQPTGYAILKEGAADNSIGTGQISIVEYSDFQCPACGAAEPYVKEILQKYGNKTKLTYKHFPLPFHQYAAKAAEASECAGDQDKFWEYHDKLFENQNKLDVGSLKKYAQQNGLDTDLFNKCLDSGTMASRVSQDKAEAKSLGVDATPTFFVNGKKHVGVLTPEKFLELSGL